MRGVSVSIPKKFVVMMSASYEDIVKFVANNLKCLICFNVFSKPVTLVCGHNYCLKCIEDYWSRNVSGAKRDCPQCRRDISSRKPEINFTLCDILELQELGGRERWEQILTETEHAGRTITKVDSLMKHLDWLKTEIKKTEDSLSAELNSNQACEDGFYSSAVPMDVPSSSIDSDASSYADRSFSVTSGDHQDQSSQYSTEESSQEFIEEDPVYLSEDADLSAGAQQHNSDGAEAPHAKFVELSFSPELGNRRLVFDTESRTMATQPGHQVRTSHGRFDACQWMAKQEFTEEWFYWDVDTTRSTGWAVGVAYPTLMRNEILGRSSSSWCLEWSCGQLSACHNNIKTPVKHSVPNGIRVILDMAKGQLCFHSLDDSLLELHSFHINFTGPLSPIFWLYGLSKCLNALTFPLQ
ncbi:E3 ubiquitin-protein ligase RNF135 isoform X2 [Siphateles boraxobius]|uniref:E3 ubiquitin-protein ligase RNF135 isoform X2 n=1 Tax=Siphateles boraxobius TaxID=180520 RepID=UPI004063FC09